MNTFPQLDPKKSIAQSEEAILKLWQERRIFERTIESRSEHNEFRFFDGPPFATGLPHYGHILAGTIKDAIPRYKTMQGYRVNRKWGWDCHGVPVEFQVEKEHQIGGKPGIEKMGVAKFNELCRSVVLRCADDWEKTVHRMGRFVDFQNDYKTMDPEFMESVWWVFGELWDKGLIYEGEKVVAYSPKLGSPLSNFEANLNYKDIDDPAVTVKFELVEEPNTYFLAWTTTPWTLPSNLALAVHPELDYSLVNHEGAKYWVANSLVEKHFGEEADVERTEKGTFLAGTKYTPLFPFFKDHEGAFQILLADYVSAEDGTGIVHQAPNFGEDDAKVCFDHGIKPLMPQPINDSGYFDDQISELAGKYFRADTEVEGSKENNANDWVMTQLKENDLLFKREQIRHSYPHCWRTDCALMYRGIQTWFVNVQKIKDLMIEKNQDINWLPAHLKNGRFGKMLEGAPDWAISRNRYWGAPIPVWKCDCCGATEVATSRAALEQKTGEKVEDLHKHFVDDLSWKCEKCDGKMTRIEEVLDCWFESGSMPYASNHFHGETADFPAADFIAEGLDQTRGWFYTLHVLGCALFDKNIFKNVVTNGIVLAEDGQKMSKSKKNYPDPNLVFDKYGADAMRYYLLSSPVVRGENFRFAESGVAEVLKSIILPLRSTYQFFSTYANIDGWQPTEFTFVRHGEGEHNVAEIYSGNVENEHHLTEKGQGQVRETAQHLDAFDVLIASPFIRTQETAQILKQETGFSGEIVTDDRVRELSFGELEGKAFLTRRERMANPTTETSAEVEKRLREFLSEMGQKYAGKKVVVCSHGGVLMALDGLEARWKTHDEILRLPVAQTGKTRSIFPEPETDNELDKWILSELQGLLQEYSKKMDAYDLEGALRPIPVFIDQLNNWYLRRNRQRFWAKGLSPEKASGYETLHHVLLTLSKLLAPICPFFAEELFLNLCDGESVHLELIPQARHEWEDADLDQKMDQIRDIVGLSAGIRARAKIKLRQPLSRLQVAVTNPANLDLDVIAAEANVKTVEILSEEELAKIATKIVKVNARMVGKKFGKKVQELIQKGKSGEFTVLENGGVEIASEHLQEGEYELGYLTAEGVEAEASAKAVVLLDTEITPELEQEGLARELIRAIQEGRKNAGFEISDRITVQWNSEDEEVQSVFATFGEKVAHEVLANSLTQETSLDAESQIIADKNVQLKLIKD
jgi:isoleucyl-tRNA synthetase